MSSQAADLFRLAQQAEPDTLLPVPPALAATPSGRALAELGVRLTHIGIGRSVAEMRIRPVHLNQRGFAQGGIVVLFADAGAGWATDTVVEPDADYTTLELKTNLLRAGRIETNLIASAEVIHAGSRTVVVAVEVYAVSSTTGAAPRERSRIAQFSCTQLVLPGRPSRPTEPPTVAAGGH